MDVWHIYLKELSACGAFRRLGAQSRNSQGSISRKHAAGVGVWAWAVGAEQLFKV